MNEFSNMDIDLNTFLNTCSTIYRYQNEFAHQHAASTCNYNAITMYIGVSAVLPRLVFALAVVARRICRVTNYTIGIRCLCVLASVAVA